MDLLLRVLAVLAVLFAALLVMPVLQGVAEGLYALLSIPGNSGRSQEFMEKHCIPENERTWSPYEDYRRSDTWEAKRQKVLKRAKHRCETDGCNRKARCTTKTILPVGDTRD